MSTIGPYQLLQRLGTCQVGQVWWAVDAEGNHASLAVLDAEVAGDERWRQCFAGGARALAPPRANTIRLAGSDFTARAPWVACVADTGPGAAQVFVALGQEYQPDEPAVEPAVEPVPVPVPTAVPAPRPRPALRGNPWATPPSHLRPGRSDEPEHGMAPVPADVTPAPEDSAPAPAPAPAHVVVQPRRGRLALVAAAVVPVLVLAGGGAAAYRYLPSSATFHSPAVGATTGTAGPTGPTGPADPADPSVSMEPLPVPSQPGGEPPLAGTWPATWPKFAGTEPTRTISGLPGVPVDFAVPQGWTCVEAQRTDTAGRYTCRSPGTGAAVIGGEVVVRACPDPCPAELRVRMRRAEEAWGLRWTRAGGFLSWAEGINVGGSNRYGVVFVAFWRSPFDGPVNRQLVFRMTAPFARADDIRKVANSLRDAIR